MKSRGMTPKIETISVISDTFYYRKKLLNPNFKMLKVSKPKLYVYYLKENTY